MSSVSPYLVPSKTLFYPHQSGLPDWKLGEPLVLPEGTRFCPYDVSTPIHGGAHLQHGRLDLPDGHHVSVYRLLDGSFKQQHCENPDEDCWAHRKNRMAFVKQTAEYLFYSMSVPKEGGFRKPDDPQTPRIDIDVSKNKWHRDYFDPWFKLIQQRYGTATPKTPKKHPPL